MKKNETLIELLIGIVIIGIIIQIGCLIISKNYLYDAIGLWAGVGICCFSAIHMNRSIEDAMDIGESGAVKYIRKQYVIRMFIVILVIGSVIYFQLGNYVTLLIGVFPLKLSAYLQPITHKIMIKYNKGG